MSVPLQRSRPESCLSDLYLDELVAGEAADPEAGREHLASCVACAERLAAIEADRKAFEAAAPGLALPSSARDPRRPWLWPAVAATSAALAAAALFVAVTQSDRDGATAPGIRSKGGARLGFFVKRGDAVREGAPGEIVHPGDSLRFTYSNDRAAYLAIVSVDGAERVTVYFPHTAAAERVEPGQDRELPGSTILDDTSGGESIYALFCERPEQLGPLRAAFAASPRNPPIPTGCAVDRVTIEKRQPR